MVVRLAVRLSFTFKESLVAQLLAAMGARKVLWMPSFTKSSNNLSTDRLIAAGTRPLAGTLFAHIVL